MSKKFTSTVAGASILLTVVGLLSRGLGLIREIVFAGSFGLSKEYDLFLVGTVIPLTINTIILYIAQNYFIPLYNRLKLKSPEEAKAFIFKSLLMFISGGVLVLLLIFLFSFQIIEVYLKNPDMAETATAVKVLRIYAFSIPLNAAFSILAAFLYSEFDFKLPTFSQLLVNIVVIISVIFLSGKTGVVSIAIGYLIGIILQMSFTIIYIIKTKFHILRIKGGGTKLFYWDSGLILIIIIESLSQVYLISDRYFVSEVAKGGIAALNYSMNIFMLPITVISAALSTALFPSFSKSFVENNVNEIIGKLTKFFSLNLYLFIPLTFLFFFFGDVIIIILFQRGVFSSNDSIMTFETLKYFSISLIFYSGYAILNKIIYSMEFIKELLLITLIGCTIKVFGNLVFVGYFRQDGLALSSSISYIFFFISSLMLVRKKLHFNINSIFLYKLVFILFNAFLALLISRILVPGIIKADLPANLIQISQMLVFLLVFFVNSFLTETEKIFSLPRKFSFRNF